MGDRVRVSRGALAGLDGEVIRELENGRLLVALSTPGVCVAIQSDFLEALQDPKDQQSER